MDEKTDYSPVRRPAPEAERRHERRLARAFVLGAHGFWLYALAVAGIVVLVYFVVG